ncbi:MAG TPA: anthranilate synthase component I [bacterium]|nr:anthranilate synthase component I [bacterium]
MINFTLKQALKHSKKYNVIPLYRETLADLETPLSAYMKIDNPEYSFLLESVEGGENVARYSYISREPFGTVEYKDGVMKKRFGKKEEVIETRDPLGELKRMFGKYRVAPVPGLPARGGAVGFVGYDVAKLYNKVPSRPQKDTIRWPDMFFMFTDVLLVFDHVSHKIKVVYCLFTGENDTRAAIAAKYRKGVEAIARIIKGLREPLKPGAAKGRKTAVKIRSHTTKNVFKKKVADTVKLIKNGEAIQVVISRRFSAATTAEPLEIYRKLRVINPSPYMHYLRFGENVIIGASPEVMIKVEGGKAMVRPIAGTRKRGASAEEDRRLEKELLSDEKERAEHVMLIDLGRNDIGKVSKTGTVSVDDLMAVEKYSHVMHIVSGVTGTLKKNMDAFDAFKAVFPAGTVSGAPKVRAMQIIDEFEDEKRGPYSGAVGYISYSGSLNTCISLRSVYYKNKTAYMQAGAGIVADSKPEAEHRETLNKAGAVFKAVIEAGNEDE